MIAHKKVNLSTFKWNNRDLIDYYENVSIEEFKEFTVKGGLAGCCDVEIIYPYIKSTAALLEVASGCGRVIDGLLQLGYAGKIYGIERSQNFFNYAVQAFKNNPKVDLILGDISEYKPNQKFEAVLWMWAGISDFSKNEQLSIIKKLKNFLAPGGVFIIETINHNLVPKNATFVIGKNYMIEAGYGNAYGYLPSSEEIKNYAKQVGLSYIKKINYETSTGRDRIIHILRG